MNRYGMIALAWVALGTLVAAVQPEAVSIKATRKSAGSRDGGNITAGKNIKIGEQDIYYAIDIRSMSANPQEDLRVEWVVLVETLKGKLRVASEGRETVSLIPGQTQTVETPTFFLRSESGPKGKKFKGEIEGVAVRIHDAAGNLVGDMYDPASRRKQLEEAFAGEIRARKQQ